MEPYVGLQYRKIIAITGNTPLVSIIVPFTLLMIIELFPRTDKGVFRFNEMMNVSSSSWATASIRSAKVMSC